MQTTQTKKVPILRSFLKDSPFLSYLICGRKHSYDTTIANGLFFFLIPFVILETAYSTGNLVIPGKGVGLLEDYLFLSFSFMCAPLFVQMLAVILNRFSSFLEDIPAFTINLPEREYETLKGHYIAYVGTKHKWASAAKYLAGAVAVTTNFSSIIARPNSWNSISNRLLFGLFAAYFIFIVMFVLSEVLIKYLRVISAQVLLTKHLVLHQQLTVKPVAPDRSGGLRSLGELALSFTYILVPFVVILLVQYFTWDYVTDGFLIGLVSLLLLSCFVFFYPLSIVHRAMYDAKRGTLRTLSEEYTTVTKALWSSWKDAAPEKVTLQKTKIELLDNLYRRAEEMPVWPFNVKTVTRFTAVAFGPILLVIIEAAVQKVIAFWFS